MIEGVSAIGSASQSASVRSPQSTAAPAEGPSVDQALKQAIGSAIDTLQTGEAGAIQGGDGGAAFAADRSRDPRQGGRRLSRDCANDDLIGVSRQVRFGVEAEDAE